VTGQVTGQVIGQVTGQVICQVTGQVRRLIQIVRGDTKTREEIMKIMHLTHRENFRLTYTAPAIADGYVAMLYPDNPKRKGQAYYLTPKGLELLTKINTNSNNN
jgi:ATP-dependent DNA helicase RecG